MATLLDLGPLTFFLPFLVWVLVFVLLYALFNKFSIFGKEQPLHALVAALFAFIFVLVKPLRELITNITPWFVVLFFLVIIILIAVMMLGISQDDVTKYVKDNAGVTVTFVIIIVIIFLVGANEVFPDSIGFKEDDNSGAFRTFNNIIFHPKILGVLFIIMASYFIIRAVGFAKK